jgi:MFS family permease
MEELVLYPEYNPSSDVPPESQALPEALQPPTRKVSVGFLLALTVASAVLYLCYIGIGGLLLPMQISTIDPVHKVANLGIVTSIAVLLALIGNPLAGALSDRTTSRFGRRRPWIFSGALLSAAALAIMMSAQSIVMIFIGWAAFQLFSNFILAALTALIPDQVPEAQRGTASGIVGLAASVGSIIGSIIIGIVIKVPAPSYLLMIVLLLVVLVPYSIFLREKALPREHVQPFHIGAFLKNFWVSPRKHPDFAWAWLTRFIPIFGYFLGTGYLFYYLQDAVHYQQLFPGQSVTQGVSTLTIISTVVSIVFTLVGGILSDRFKRRKLFIVLSSIITAGALLIFGFVPSWPILMIAMAVLGIGFGTYMSVDGALVTQVLPSANDRAKDMGIINIANTLPQSLGPAVAAFLITSTHSYLVLFAVGAVITLCAALVVRPIKAVR